MPVNLVLSPHSALGYGATSLESLPETRLKEPGRNRCRLRFRSLIGWRPSGPGILCVVVVAFFSDSRGIEKTLSRSLRGSECCRNILLLLVLALLHLCALWDKCSAGGAVQDPALQHAKSTSGTSYSWTWRAQLQQLLHPDPKSPNAANTFTCAGWTFLLSLFMGLGARSCDRQG